MSKIKSIIFLIFTVGLFVTLLLKGSSGDPTVDEINNQLSKRGFAFETSQERTRYALAKNMAAGDLTLDKFSSAALPDVSYKDGHYYSVFPPGVSFLILPAMLLGEKFGQPVIFSFAVPGLFLILTAVFTYLLALRLRLSSRVSLLVALMFSLSTIALGYSVTLYAHIFSAFFLVAGLYFALDPENRQMSSFFVWSFYGLSVLVDYPNILVYLPIALLTLYRSFNIKTIDFAGTKKKFLLWRPSPLLYSLVFFLLILLLGLYNRVTLGGMFEMAHNYRVTDIVQGAADYHFGLDHLLTPKNAINGLYTLLFSKDRGIIYFCPILILAIAGLFQFVGESRRQILIFCVICYLQLMVYASFYDPWGGWSFGPRYLIAIMPLLAVMAGGLYERFRRSNIFVLFYMSVALLSSAIAFAGASTTNLIAPSAETGSETFFFWELPKLFDVAHGSLFFNWLTGYFHIPLFAYVVAVFGLAALVYLGFFLSEIALNLTQKYRKRSEQRYVQFENKELNVGKAV